MSCSPKVVVKVSKPLVFSCFQAGIEKDQFKIIKVDLKFKQKPSKINVKNFILCSVGRAIPIV